MNYLIQLIEIYGIKPTFTINAKSSYSNMLDHIVSSLTILLLFLFTLFFFLDLFGRKNPHIISTEYIDIDPETIDLRRSDFIFAIGLQDENYINYLNESIYSIELKLVTSKMSLQSVGYRIKEEATIELTTCDKIFMPVLSNFFDRLPLNQLYCIKNASDLYIEGSYMSSTWVYLKYEVKKCDNRTFIAKGKEPKCASQEVIDSTLSKGFFSYYVSDYSVFTNEYNNPIKVFGKNYFTTINHKLSKIIWTYFKTIQFETDNAWLFTNNHTKKIFCYDKSVEHFNIENNNNTFVTLFVRCSDKRQIISRSYIKVDIIIAKTITMGMLIISIVKFFMLYFQKMLYYSYICSFYKFESSIRTKYVKKKTEMKDHNVSGMTIHNLIQFKRDREIREEEGITKKNQNTSIMIQKTKTITLQKDGSKQSDNQVNSGSNKIVEELNSSKDILPYRQLNNSQLECIIKKKKNHPRNKPFKCRTLCKFCTCNIETIYKFKYVKKTYKNIGIYLELVRFLKLYNDVDLLKRVYFDDNQYRLIEHDYFFYKNSDITYQHYMNKFKIDSKGNKSFSHLIVQSSVS